MIRTKGEAGTGDVVNAVTHMRAVFGGIRRLQSLRADELYAEAKNLQAPYELVRWVAENGRLPVVTFTAGGIATPADASLCMQLGADGVFVGSGIFKSGDPELRAKAIVEATTHFQDAKILAEVSTGLGEPMVGISSASLADERAARSPRLVARSAGHRARLHFRHEDRCARAAGRVPRARRDAAAARCRRGRGAPARAARRARRPRHPGRRVDHDDAPDGPLRARRGDPLVSRPDLRHLRRHDRARPGAARPDRPRRRAERLRPSGRELRGSRSAIDGDESRFPASSSERPGSPTPGPESLSSPSSTGSRCSRAKGGFSSRRSTPS